MSADLAVTAVASEGTVALTVEGDIDAATEDRFNRALRDAVFEAESAVKVDLSQVPFIGSCGVHVLVRSWNLAEERQVRLSISSASPHVERVLELMGLSGTLSDPS